MGSKFRPVFVGEKKKKNYQNYTVDTMFVEPLNAIRCVIINMRTLIRIMQLYAMHIYICIG